MSETANTFKLRILNNGGTAIAETRDINFQTWRYSHAKKKELKAKIDFDNFAKFDWQKRGPNNEPTIIEFDGLAQNKVIGEAEEEVIKLLWGIVDVDLNRVPAEDFAVLKEKAMSIDPLGRGLVEKKMGELSQKNSEE